jgi:hypothetical protein
MAPLSEPSSFRVYVPAFALGVFMLLTWSAVAFNYHDRHSNESKLKDRATDIELQLRRMEGDMNFWRLKAEDCEKLAKAERQVGAPNNICALTADQHGTVATFVKLYKHYKPEAARVTLHWCGRSDGAAAKCKAELLDIMVTNGGWAYSGGIPCESGLIDVLPSSGKVEFITGDFEFRERLSALLRVMNVEGVEWKPDFLGDGVSALIGRD